MFSSSELLIFQRFSFSIPIPRLLLSSSLLLLKQGSINDKIQGKQATLLFIGTNHEAITVIILLLFKLCQVHASSLYFLHHKILPMIGLLPASSEMPYHVKHWETSTMYSWRKAWYAIAFGPIYSLIGVDQGYIRSTDARDTKDR
jgi:hypothetical protein